MNQFKKFYKSSLVLSFLFLLLVGGSFVATARAESTPVKLCSAKIVPLYTRGVLQGYKTIGMVEVKESGFDEQVEVHYSYGYDNWKQIKAEFVGINDQDHQIWKFETPENKPSFHYYKFTTEFAVNYKKDGQDYWDNNEGENYFLRMTNVPNFSNQPYLLGSQQVVLEDAHYHQYNGSATLMGQVIVKNLAYNKDIQLVYTTDDWQTTNTVAARYYTQYENNLEEWGFALRDLSPDAKIKYRIKYNVKGNTYWDDNFGRDYVKNSDK